MTVLVPNRFLFSFEFALARWKGPAVIDGDVSKWSDREALPKLGEIDGTSDFADVWACWDECGLYVACRVTEKKRPLRCDPRKFWLGDNLRLCTDTRDTRTVKRATRFCQQFYFLPAGGGNDGKQAVAGAAKIQRAREEAPPIQAEKIVVVSVVEPGGYSLEAHLPAECLNGFDPVDHPRMGFYYILEDGDHGQQYLTVSDDLNWHVDPSTWSTARLTDR